MTILFVIWLFVGTIGGIIHAIHVLIEQDGKIYRWNVIVGIITFPSTTVIACVWGLWYLFARSKYREFFIKEVADFNKVQREERRSRW